MRGALPALAALAALAGCAEDPLALAPFPCAADATCPDGLTCALGASADPVGVCSLPCAASSECDEGSRCAGSAAGEGGDPEAGACLPECTPFALDVDLACPGGSTCRLARLAGGEGYFATCLAVVPGRELRAACASALDCPPQASCYQAAPDQPATCRPQCDAAHPCRGDHVCRALIPSGAGVCL